MNINVIDYEFYDVLDVEDWGIAETIDIEVKEVHCFYARERNQNIIGISHNSAQLAIGDWDDLEFLKAKRWDLGSVPNWRSNSNNSIVPPINLKDLPTEFWQTYEQGEPYGLINLELSRNCGRLGETQYKDSNIVGYNPCVSGDTEILTDIGYVRIDTVINTKVNVWTGYEFSTVTPKITGYDQPMLNIILSTGQTLKCTYYHNFILSTGERIRAIDLKLNDELVKFEYPELLGIDKFSNKNVNELSKIIGIEQISNEDIVYCFDEPIRHSGCFNGIITGQCAEQSLENFETCCLAEIFLPNIESESELFEVAEFLYRINKHSLALPCSIPETEDIVHKNMRMGIGVTGLLQSTEEQKTWLTRCYDFLRKYDAEYSKEHNWPISIKLTTTKPSGTLSLLPGVTPGIHPSPAGPYYIRRIRMAANSNLVQVCKDNGYFVEFVRGFDGKPDFTTVVVEFPCKVPEGTPVGDSLGAIEHLNLIKWMQTNWSDNSVSCTVYYSKEELPAIQEWLNENFNNSLKTVSFLLYYGHGFDQAPYETISKERYDELIKNVKPIHKITVQEDDFDVQDCDNGSCPIK